MSVVGAEDWAVRLLRVVTFSAGYNTTLVVLGTTLLGIAAGIVGSFTLLRKRSLLSDALSHATLPGVGGAFIAASLLGTQGRSIPVLLLGAAVSAALGVVCVQVISRWRRVGEEAAIGIVLSVFFGVGVVLLSVIQSMSAGNQGGLKSFIYGQTAAMSSSDAWLMGGIALVAAGCGVLLLKEFTVVCFDEDFAASSGWPVSLVDLIGMTLVLIVTVAGLQAVGLLMIVAMLIIPAAAARFWTERAGRLVIIAAVIGGLSGLLGASISAVLPRKPAGAVIVLTAGSLFLIGLLCAPRRGVFASVLRRAGLALRVAEDHALRALEEQAESGEPLVSISALRDASGLSGVSARFVVVWLRARGLVRVSGRSVRMTERGKEKAIRVTRNHRLWERYLIEHADVAATHVDFSADLVEHVLSPDLVARLESQLRAEGRLPSPHAIEQVLGAGRGAGG